MVEIGDGGGGDVPEYMRKGLQPLRITQLLIECGADPNAYDKFGQTPLHLFFAAEIYRPSIKLLDKHIGVLNLLKEAWAHTDCRLLR